MLQVRYHTTVKNKFPVTLTLYCVILYIFNIKHMILLNTRIQPGPLLLSSVLFENYAGTWIDFICKQMKNLSSRSIYVVIVNVKYHYLCWFDAERRLFMNKMLDWCKWWEYLFFEIARTTGWLLEVISNHSIYLASFFSVETRILCIEFCCCNPYANKEE
jgi:hypothetical protein